METDPEVRAERAPLLLDSEADEFGLQLDGEGRTQKRSLLERISAAFPLRDSPYRKVLLRTVLVLGGVIVGVLATNFYGSSETVCLTPECINLASSILSSLDTSYDPCENLYDYASGGWRKANPLPSDEGRFGQFNKLTESNQRVIMNLLESDSIPHLTNPDALYDEEILRKLRGLYRSCMDEKRLDEVGQEPLERFVGEVRRLFRGSSGEQGSGLTEALAFMHARGVDLLFTFDIDGDVGLDPDVMTLGFTQPSLGLPAKNYYNDTSSRDAYRDVVERILLALSDEDSPDPNQIRDIANAVLEFETDIANAKLDLDVLWKDPFRTYNPTPLSDLSSALPEIDFPAYFATFNPPSPPTRIIVTYLPYATSLSQILARTPSDIIEAYLVTRAALTLAPNLGTNTEVWQAAWSLKETVEGIRKGTPVGGRDGFCAGSVEHALGFAAGRYFVSETLGGGSKGKAEAIIADIVNAFKKTVSEIAWMDNESAQAAVEKADAIRVKVGYPTSPDTLIAKSIADYYSDVEINEDQFFENMLSASVSDTYKKWRKLGEKRDMGEWEMYPSRVNSYYNPPANEIVFPAGILRPPFFSPNWPSYISYGAFGAVAAHELMHAFDSSGRLYNRQGKLEQWWTNATSEAYDTRRECIVNQFSEYTVDDGRGGTVHVNGNFTTDENIADGALIQAYRAWKAQYKTGKDYVLPGLNYTSEQLFFLSFARSFSENITPQTAVANVRSDPHSPNRYRCDGTVSNVAEFAEAFQCSKRAKLNPSSDERCIFW